MKRRGSAASNTLGPPNAIELCGKPAKYRCELQSIATVIICRWPVGYWDDRAVAHRIKRRAS